MNYRGAFRLLSCILFVLLITAGPLRITLADTPTPAPTPSPVPPGGNVNSNFNIYVDKNAALPWPLPAMPTFPVATATATLYNATPLHGTTYAGQLATTTAQVGNFTGPVNSISTPIAAAIGSASTPSGTDFNTGIDAGTGTISFSGFADQIGDGLGDAVGNGFAFIRGLYDLGSYSPIVGIFGATEIVGLIMAAFLFMLPLIVKAGQWIINFVIRLFTLIGSWIPG